MYQFEGIRQHHLPLNPPRPPLGPPLGAPRPPPNPPRPPPNPPRPPANPPRPPWNPPRPPGANPLPAGLGPLGLGAWGLVKRSVDNKSSGFMQKICPSLKPAALTPSAGLTLKQKALSGPKIQSTDPTFDLFYRQTPLLNLGNLDISVHFTTNWFSDLCKKIPQGITYEGGP